VALSLLLVIHRRFGTLDEADPEDERMKESA
jgi:hypothetical protein